MTRAWRWLLCTVGRHSPWRTFEWSGDAESGIGYFICQWCGHTEDA